MDVKPEYNGNSIVNLMSSIMSAFEIENPYEPLHHDLGLSNSKNLVLMIIDGLGYNYLIDKGQETQLAELSKSSVTSVFLPSTGPAISTFFTGVAPQQHAITGWYVHLPEYGLVSRFLPFTPAINWNVLSDNISEAVGASPMPIDNREHYVVLGEDIVDSVYSRFMSGNAERFGFTNMKDFFGQVRKAISSGEKSYVHAYWPQFDTIAHLLGVESAEARDHLQTFDNALQSFIKEIEGTDTTLLITSDHGFHDVNIENVMYTKDHPDLMDCLVLPLCGDTRTVYCYVHPSKVSEFESYVSENLGDACDLFLSQELVDSNWFGLFEPSPKLLKRIGDYTLVFKEGYAAMNCFPGSQPHEMRGHHGGISEDEMRVPLIVIDC